MKVPSDMKPGDLLAQADLASYVGAMAKGVAEAQKALDHNTIGLLGEFTQPLPGLANKSLLQLGLSPAFYHFRSATLSCSVSMTLRVREEIEVAVHLGVGTSQDSSASTASSSQQTQSAHDSVTFSDQFVAKSNASSNASAMEALDSYSESNTATHFVLAEREALATTDKSGFQQDGLVRYDAKTALFVVPPDGKYWVVFGFVAGSGVADTFQVKAQGAFAPNAALPNAKALALAFKQHLADPPAIGTVYMLSGDGSAGDLTQVLFENDSYLVKTVAGKDYQVRLRALAQIVVAAGLGHVTVTGHTDGLGPADYNKRLSELRAQSVAAILRANGVSVDSETGLGEQNAGGSQAANPALRKVEIGFQTPVTGSFVYAEDDPAAFNSSLAVVSSSVNGLRAAAAYPNDGKIGNVTVKSAQELKQQFSSNSQLEASLSGELVYLTYSATSQKKVANVRVYRDQSSSQTVEQTTDLDVEQESATDSALSQAAGTKVNRASAVVASLDARYARMFDLTMSGNMSIAAELVSIPAPPEFLQFIKDYLED